MKIFSWMQSKINGGRQEVKKQTGISQHHNQVSYSDRKEEFNDWPNALLAIGTFGNNDVKEKPQTCDIQDEQISTDENADFTPEEVGKLEQELTKLLSRKKKEPECQLSEDGSCLPLDQFLNCPSSLEVDRRKCASICGDTDEKDNDGNSSSVVLSSGKDVLMDKSKSIHKRSVSFLLKKLFVCKGGFGPTHSLADPIPESRMEKLLRTILHKKMYPQSSSTTSGKKYLGDRHSSKNIKDDQLEEKRDSSKWVKTDSEYIVLEI
ncbi:hypothetical protein ACHQM5_029368 [Ranunculus cassubicifolius]